MGETQARVRGGRRSSLAALLVALVATLVATGLTVAPQTAAAQEVEGTDEPGEASEASESGGESARVLERIHEITERVVAARGLAADREIPAGVHSRETLREALIELIDAEYPPERFRAEGALYEMLGILPPGTDYRGLMVDLLTSQIAGFYDDAVGELFILDDLDFVTLEPTLAHEIFHGIQDQRYGIDAVRGEWPTADDALLAASALFEGDAVAVMIEYLVGGTMGLGDFPGVMDLAESQLADLDQATAGMPIEVPPFIMQLLLFPYSAGLSFVLDVKQGGGWEAVNAVYLDPPRSTEQVLHPERYLERDAPTWLTLTLGQAGEAGWEVVYDQVFGELQLHALLSQVLGESISERAVDRACEGWDGDRVLLLESAAAPGERVLAWLSVWDSEGDAEAFAAVWRRFVEVRRGEALRERAAGPHGSLWQADAGSSGAGTAAVVERWGDMVLYLDGVPEASQGSEALDRWREEAWRGRARGPYVQP